MIVAVDSPPDPWLITAVLAVIAIPLCFFGVKGFRALNRHQHAEIESKRAAARDLPDGWLDRRMPMSARVLVIVGAVVIFFAAMASGSNQLLWILIPPYLAISIYLSRLEEKTMVAELTDELRAVIQSDGVAVAMRYIDSIESVHGKHAAARIRSNLGIL